MALAGLARVPGYKVSIATLAPLVLMPLVVGLDARAGLPEGATFPWLLARQPMDMWPYWVFNTPSVIIACGPRDITEAQPSMQH